MAPMVATQTSAGQDQPGPHMPPGSRSILVEREKLERLHNNLQAVYQKYPSRPLRQAVQFVAALLDAAAA